jgi:hypothetical protein
MRLDTKTDRLADCRLQCEFDFDINLSHQTILILDICILLCERDQGEGVLRLHNITIVGFYYLFNCATCFLFYLFIFWPYATTCLI